jgi:inositol-pentakisphosphate 2-kinase
MSSTNSPPPALPGNTDLSYIAEGAANIICRFRLPDFSPTASTTELDSFGPSTPPPTEIFLPTYNEIFFRKLLRLRKAIPSRVTNASAVQYFKTVMVPLFPEKNLVSQDLVSILPSHIHTLNGTLRTNESESRRPGKRHGTYLATDEEHGILVTDMTPDQDLDETLIEFKPKWLAQSPTAPKDARRCRTCALKDMRNLERLEKGETLEHGFCPLDLVSEKPGDMARAVDIIAIHSDSEARSRIASFLSNDPLLPLLREHQVFYMQRATSSNDSTALVTAMTLRDCTVFVKICNWKDSNVELRLGDLDLKNEAKMSKWSDLERRLIDEGWYAGRSVEGGGSPCKLGRDLN